MEISIASDVAHQPSSTSPKRRQPPVATTTTSADPVFDQFQQMRSMISTFLGACQDPTPSTKQSFYNYLHSEIEHLEDRSPKVKRSPHINFQNLHRPQQDVNTYSPYWKLKQPTQISKTQPATVIAKVQQPSRPSSASAQPTSYVVVDDQQLGTSRQMIFNPPSVAASQQEESQHNTSRLSSLFGAIPSVLQYLQMDTPQPFSPSQLQLQPAPSPVQFSTHHEQSRPPSQSSQQSQPRSAD